MRTCGAQASGQRAYADTMRCIPQTQPGGSGSARGRPLLLGLGFCRRSSSDDLSTKSSSSSLKPTRPLVGGQQECSSLPHELALTLIDHMPRHTRHPTLVSPQTYLPITLLALLDATVLRTFMHKFHAHHPLSPALLRTFLCTYSSCINSLALLQTRPQAHRHTCTRAPVRGERGTRGRDGGGCRVNTDE